MELHGQPELLRNDDDGGGRGKLVGDNGPNGEHAHDELRRHIHAQPNLHMGSEVRGQNHYT